MHVPGLGPNVCTRFLGVAIKDNAQPQLTGRAIGRQGGLHTKPSLMEHTLMLPHDPKDCLQGGTLGYPTCLL